MAETMLLADAFLVDCVGNEPRERVSVAVEGGRISRVFEEGSRPSGSWDRVVVVMRAK